LEIKGLCLKKPAFPNFEKARNVNIMDNIPNGNFIYPAIRFAIKSESIFSINNGERKKSNK